MKQKPKKFSLFPKLEPLEVYLLAADNPIGKRQLRPIFRRKRSKEVLTREQVTAIKRGRRVLRREMKERGIKRWIDFNITATNLGLYFDHKGLLWPIFLWFMGGNTAVKILATTAVLTTLMTMIQPVVEYVTQYVTQYLTQYVTQYLTEYRDRDRFTINVSDNLRNAGFELSETPDFASPQEILLASPLTEVPCVSIASIPHNVDEMENGIATDFFAYTFYCRYINKDAEQDTPENLEKYATNYKWGLRIQMEKLADPAQTETTAGTSPTGETETTGETSPKEETEDTTGGLKVSDAIWVMVIQDGEVILCAKEDLDENGKATVPMIPTPQDIKTKRMAFKDRSIDYINAGLKKIDSKLNVDNVFKLDTVYSMQEQIDAIQKQIDDFFETEGIRNLTKLILRTKNWEDHYNVVPGSKDDSFSYYQIEAEKFFSVEENIVAERTRTGMLPWIKDVNEEYHKYTVVIWLEGDDPQCTNELMGSSIGLNFQIKGIGEEYMDIIDSPADPPVTEPAGTEKTS